MVCDVFLFLVLFFNQKTAYELRIRDWSLDVCSSDLRYIYSESVGDYDIAYPIILTPDQYMELGRKEGMKDYFQEKIDAYSGKKEGSEQARKNLLPNSIGRASCRARVCQYV